MYYFLLGLQGLTTLIVFAEFLYIFHHGTSRHHTILMLLTLAACVNNAGYFLEIASGDREAALIGTKISYLGKTYIPLLILIFVLNYCNIQVSGVLWAVLAFFHTGIWALVLTSGQHTLFYTETEYISDAAFPHLESGHGSFYYLFMLFSGIYFCVSTYVLITHYRKETSDARKKQIVGILAVLAVSVAGLALVVSGCTGGYDTTAIAYAIGSMTLLLGIRRYDFLDTVTEAKEYAMNRLAEGLVILDEDYQVLYRNQVAVQVLPAIEDEVLNQERLFFKDKVYQIEKQDMHPKEGKQIYLYLLKDITDSYYYEEHLEREVAIQTKNAEDRRQKVEQMSLQAVRALADTIDAKDKYTKGHSARVAGYAVCLARELGYSEEELNNLRHVALLHDIGKISVPDSVLNKPDKLTDMEYEIVKTHTTVGGEILNHVAMLPGVQDGARHHHERYDGKGYPDGLAGEEIPEVARIVGLADAYDAMSSKRIYRDRLSPKAIREQLIEGRGTQFDPKMTDVFLRLLDEGKLVDEQSGMPQEEMDATGLVLQKLVETMTQKEGPEKDLLTGLMLRYDGEPAISEAIQRENGSLCFIDVDNLKKINDTLGHLAGDHLLQEVGEVLRRYEEKNIICRLGGDEFLMFIPGAGKEQAAEVIESVVRDFEEKKKEDASIQAASLSVGICVCRRGDNYSQALTNADKALYYIKQNGKAGYSVYRKDEGQFKQDSNVDMSRLIKSLQSSGNYQGALDVEYRVFTKLYEYVKNLEKRYEYKFNLALVTLDTQAEITVDEQEQAMNCMEQAIRTTIRNTDICSRYSGVQFLIIFAYVGDENIKYVMNRILENYFKIYHGKKIKVTYDVADMDMAGEKQYGKDA